jgi:transposase InsO family protein
MPWKESKPMDQRVQLIQDYQEGESIAALAEMNHVSRKTVYKWLRRYESEGMAGLVDQSREPHHSPDKVSEEQIAAIIAARQRWKWGPRKLRVKLLEREPEVDWPAVSTIGEILKTAGLTIRRKRSVRTAGNQHPLARVEEANQAWCADFKGWFRTGDGRRCDPLTISDAHSRFLLKCQITTKSDTTHVGAIFDSAFREYGLPDVIHNDNGTPFASRAPGGLSRLSMQWVKLGILPERSRPGCPQDNGRHERMHSTLKQATLRPPARNRRRQQESFDHFRQEYNHERPHESLDDATPASCYQPSCRPMPRRVPELEYGSEVTVRRVSQQGSVKMNGERTFVSEIFAYEWLGLRTLDERYYQIEFGPVKIGYLDTFRHRFYRLLPIAVRIRLGLGAN